MTRIQRYTVVETLKVFAITLLATSLLMTLGGALNECMRRGMPLLLIARLLPYLVPETMRLTIPASLLFAICTVFGRMSASGEITAIKSLGIHPFRIFSPALVLAYILSLVTFAMYEVCAAWARPNLERAVVTAIDKVAYAKLRVDRVLKSNGVTITVRDVVDGRLIEPTVEIPQKDGSAVLYQADAAMIEAVGDSGMLRIQSYDSSFVSKNMTLADPAISSQEIPFQDPANQNPDYRSPAGLELSLIRPQIEKELRRLNEFAADDELTEDRRKEKDKRTTRLYRLRAEAQRRLANGFAVFSFVMVGIPIATWARSTDNMSVFFSCVVPISLIYYPLLATGEELAKRGICPQATVWIAPVVLTMIGGFLFDRLVRH